MVEEGGGEIFGFNISNTNKRHSSCAAGAMSRGFVSRRYTRRKFYSRDVEGMYCILHRNRPVNEYLLRANNYFKATW